MVATVFQKIEAFVFFLAMMLTIVLEGGIVYWIFQHPASPRTPFALTGQWTGAALPQAWLFGALLVLAYRFIGMFMPSLEEANQDGQRSRRAFLRLWRWTIALIAMQGFAFFLERAVGS